MFLKRIEMKGFKSFADQTIINFDDPVIGIVGPNGCGKSNISDAIRWVLGEQSSKQLRGEKMTDVIFSGSDSHRAVNMAEVSLVFDNSKRTLNYKADEIKISRRIYNTSQEAEYLINSKNVRLKDITDIILDSGLGKDSLSIISQGNISAFAEAKPYDRRMVFEEAAGVAKYRKSKSEAISRLERTKENLERAYISLSELEKQVNPLRKQADKAKIYRQKKERLATIETAVLLDDIKAYQEQKKDIEKNLFDLKTDISVLETAIQLNENNNTDAKEQLNTIDQQINTLQEELFKIISDISTYETQKVEINEKRKYLIENSDNEKKLEALNSDLQDSYNEYEDRLLRLQTLENELKEINNSIEQTATKLADSYLEKENKNNRCNILNNRLSLLENLLKDPFSGQSQAGVKTVMDNRQSLNGILGVVGQDLKAQKGKEYAVSAALASSVYHIITINESSARQAISFLKKNQAGRATFLPLTVLQDHPVRHEDQIICDNFKGYLGNCEEFVDCDPQFDIVALSLLGNVLVCDTLENANELSELLGHNYKIVTLDGDIVHRGGSMTGGRVKNETSIVVAQSEIDKIKADLISLDAARELAEKNYNYLLDLRVKLDKDLTEKRISIAKLEAIVESKKAAYDKIETQIKALNPDYINEANENYQDELVNKLNNLYKNKDNLSETIKAGRNEHLKLNNEIQRRDQQLRQNRRQLDENNKALIKLSTSDAAIDAGLKVCMDRLSSEYSLTYEFALENNDYELKGDEKEEVITLRKEINDLGAINMSAPEEFEKINERYQELDKNYKELLSSRDKILDTIQQMDSVMKKQFSETFDEINKELPNIFNLLFGGGKAKLVLEDPEDILNTGIDIDVQPPGKQVKSIRLFSGGEKAMIALCVLFTILKVKPSPLIVFDEVESALDQANVEKFARYVRAFSNNSQFIVITHRPGTMAQCDVLFGVTMQKRGVSELLKVKLIDAIDMAEKESEVA